MRPHIGLALVACLTLSTPTFAQEEPGDLRQRARALVELAERARASIASLGESAQRQRERIAELEAELARDPAADGPSREAAEAEIAELRARIRELETQARTRGPTLAEVRPQAEATARDALSRFAAVEPDRTFLADRLGEPVRPAPPGVACGAETASAAELLVCRTRELADLDRRLDEALRAAQSRQTPVQRRIAEQEQRLFYQRLESCIGDISALMSDEAVARARDCISSRYPPRIAALAPQDVPRQGQSAPAPSPQPAPLPGILPRSDVVYVTTRSNLRAGPTTSSRVVAQREACAELRRVGPSTVPDWIPVAFDRGTAYIASFLVSDRRPDECSRTIRGRVDRVIDPGTIVVEGREIRLRGIEPSSDDLSRRGMSEMLGLYDGQVSCQPHPAGGFTCATPARAGLPSLDVAVIAIFNGGACPAPDADPAYREARRDAERRGVRLVCR